MGSGSTAHVLGSPVEITYNCLQDAAAGYGQIPFKEGHNIDSDPLLVRLPWNGADGWGDDPNTTAVDEGENDDFGDLHLSQGSPCIGAGDPLTWIEHACTDIDGEPRIMDGVVDIGADEYSKPGTRGWVHAPGVGQVCMGGTLQRIVWDVLGYQGQVCVEYSTDMGETWQTIDPSIANAGLLDWQVPDAVDSDLCMIQVRSMDGPAPSFVAQSGLFAIRGNGDDMDVSSKWRTLGGNFQRTGRSRDLGPGMVRIRWHFDTPSAIASSPTVGANGHIHVPTSDGRLYTLDRDGRLLWVYDAGDAILSTATVADDGAVYVGCLDGSLHVVSSNGQERDLYYFSDLLAGSAALLSDGRVIVASLRQGNHVLTPHLGWSQILAKGSGFTSPTLGPDRTLYVKATESPDLYALDLDHFVLKWQASVGSSEWALAGPVAGDNGIVYQTLLGDSHLYALDARDGSTVWSVDLADPSLYEPGNHSGTGRFGTESWTEPILGPTGVVYACLNDSYLRAINPNGRIAWVRQLGVTRGFSLTVDSDGTLYAAGDDGKLHVVDPNGRTTSLFEREGPLGFPVVNSPRTILVCETKGMGQDRASGIVWALSEDQNSQVWDIGPPPGPHNPPPGME